MAFLKLGRRSLAWLYAAAAALLLVGVLAHAVQGARAMLQTATVSNDERLMYAELRRLSRSPLMDLEHSVAKVSTLELLEIGQIQVSFSDTDPAESGRQGGPGQPDRARDSHDEDLWYMDRIGKYRHAVIDMQGDVYQQAYILNFMIDRLSRVLLIESIDSDANQMSVTARVYGAEPAPTPGRDVWG